MIYAVVKTNPAGIKCYLWQLKDEQDSWTLIRSQAKRMTNDGAGHAIDIIKGLTEYYGGPDEDWRIENVGHG